MMSRSSTETSVRKWALCRHSNLLCLRCGQNIADKANNQNSRNFSPLTKIHPHTYRYKFTFKREKRVRDIIKKKNMN